MTSRANTGYNGFGEKLAAVAETFHSGSGEICAMAIINERGHRTVYAGPDWEHSYQVFSNARLNILKILRL